MNIGNHRLHKLLLVPLFLTLTYLFLIVQNLSWNRRSAKTTIKNASDKFPLENIKQRGNYFVLSNFVDREVNFDSHSKTITFATPADYRFIGNLDHLVDRWRGPFSVALYAPGHDFFTALTAMNYLRKCKNPLIRDLVSFHIFFEMQHTPQKLSWLNDSSIDCEQDFEFYASIPEEETYKKKNNLLFPINVARNIAKEQSPTHFIFVADIELNPSPRNFIDNFFEFVERRKNVRFVNKRQVFVLPVFEVLPDQKLPENKTELSQMYKNKTLFVFHEKLCKPCHEIPEFDKWITTGEDSSLDVLTVGKRSGKFNDWEPFYIGTKEEPFFDERITWEGGRNKLIQNYLMCLLDYDYFILNNAFVVHNPGIKQFKSNYVYYSQYVVRSYWIVPNVIVPQYHSLYGQRTGC